ncbi:AAA family ATPase [Paraliomyxa miuraensis]|uniref:AAA family ATPase n=1 Tax=Paraliomyxa miuraensis TaxID=376150 RepID=UPI002256AB14|nr:AAA family ATPase [Paraliomyxa miuraensis]MCX4244071.1 ATP-binding protein [Paraliomyxa miuraensis]
MSILRFEFQDDSRSPWHLEPVEFSELTLLVGISGAGKTLTLNSIAAVCAAARGRNSGLYDCRWAIEIATDAGTLTWRATTGGAPPIQAVTTRVHVDVDDASGSGVEFHGERRSPPTFVEELIQDAEGRSLVHRTKGEIRLAGSDRPIRMKDSESVVSLLQDEETMAPLFQALRKVHRSSPAQWSYIPFDPNRVRQLEESTDSVEALREATIPIGQKAYLLQRRFGSEFAAVLDAYREIFPQVREIKIGPTSELGLRSTEDEQSTSYEFLGIAIEENGVGSAISWENMSSGMRRTLRHLFELELSPRGTVLLVDEYENSMGVNCLDAVTERLLSPSRDLRLIITSHHPYVINNVPMNLWRVVTRKGSNVRIVPASEIPELDTRSKQDAFIRLLNAAEYREGIQ